MRVKDMMARIGGDLEGLLHAYEPVGRALGKSDTPPDAAYLQWLVWQSMQLKLDPRQAEKHAFCLRWKSLGCPCFTLTEGLTAKLMLTDPGSVVGQEARPPFPAFLVEVPAQYLTLRVPEREFEKSLVYLTFHAVEDPDPPVAERWSMTQFPFEKAAQLQQEILAKKGEKAWRFSGTVRDSHDVGVMWDCLPNPLPDQKLGDWCRRVLTRDEAVHQNEQRTGQLGVAHLGPETPVDSNTTRAVRTLMINLMLYLGALPVLPKSSLSKAKPLQEREGGIRNYRVGREIKLSPELRSAARDYGAQSPKQGWKLRARFTVRGHWRNQAYGSNMQKHKRIWIDPYWKGPEGGEQLQREYIIGHEEEGPL